jgi:hypothetical protein
MFVCMYGVAWEAHMPIHTCIHVQYLIHTCIHTYIQGGPAMSLSAWLEEIDHSVPSGVIEKHSLRQTLLGKLQAAKYSGTGHVCTYVCVLVCV